jgi:adenosylcobinamide kinase/adenosylcobinamide-phosphate guanylyltransferase
VVPGHELILGGQRSGKSRCAEARAAAWLGAPGRSAVLVATALAADEEMNARVERHRIDRTRSLPTMRTVEVPFDLAGALRLHSTPSCLVLVDCLTLWLTNLLMPLEGVRVSEAALSEMREDLCDSLLGTSRGPVLLVSNEIGFGVSPMTREARMFVDELGRLHQAVASICESVTLMVAGIEVPVKRPAGASTI